MLIGVTCVRVSFLGSILVSSAKGVFGSIGVGSIGDIDWIGTVLVDLMKMKTLIG